VVQGGRDSNTQHFDGVGVFVCEERGWARGQMAVRKQTHAADFPWLGERVDEWKVLRAALLGGRRLRCEMAKIAIMARSLPLLPKLLNALRASTGRSTAW